MAVTPSLRAGASGAFAVLLVSALSWAVPTPGADLTIDPGLLAVREAAWRAWFSGDAAALERVLPEDFIGIGWADGPFAGRDETIAAARRFHDDGGRLVRLEFPETRAQRYGEAVVLYGRFAITLETGGREQTVRGRLTETFVKRGGRWLHPAWHLDPVTPAPASTGR